MATKDIKLFTLVKVNDKDEKFKALKTKLLSDFKENILCEDYEPIIK